MTKCFTWVKCFPLKQDTRSKPVMKAQTLWLSRPFNVTTMKASVTGTEGKRWEVSPKSTHIFFLLLLHDWRVAWMRNWVVSEVKDLKNLPMTNVLLEPSERVQVSMPSSGFYIDHRARTGRPLGFVDFPKYGLKEESWSVGIEKNGIIFRLYDKWGQWNSNLGEDILHKMSQWPSAIYRWFRSSFVLWRIWWFLLSPFYFFE